MAHEADGIHGDLEEAVYRYVIRLKANAVLEREIEHLLKRPVVAVPRQLFEAILERIGRLAMQPSACPSG
jgi:hypothetical protein